MIDRARLSFALSLMLALYSCEYKDTPLALPPLPACGDSILTGYANKMSYFPGEAVEVFLQSRGRLDCGLGFYDMNGKLVFRAKASVFPQTVLPAEPWKNGFGFSSSGKILLPTSLASGIYQIENKITIVVKSPEAADMTVIYPSNTINAYNPSGGKSMYQYNSTGGNAASTVSFLRPMDSPVEKEECSECLKWFPSLTNIKVNYIADVDLEDYGSLRGSIIVVVGHSEYWTRQARANFDRFVDGGGHALILSGNTMWWQVRYTGSKDGLICHRTATEDPEPDTNLKTIRWVDPALQYPIVPSIGEDFDHGGYGLLAPIEAWDADGFPILDNDTLLFAKLGLGFDRGTRAGQETFPMFTVMQKTTTSGVIVNVGSIGWCSPSGMGNHGAGEKIKAITKNALDKLLTGKNVFSF